jgi:hypothetical protein
MAVGVVSRSAAVSLCGLLLACRRGTKEGDGTVCWGVEVYGSSKLSVT